jgi:hypothetical protein
MNPITGPAIVNISGGRSSALMLRLLLDACDGALPPDVVPVFANTGEEAEGTLIFVREIAERWNAPIRWIEFAPPRGDAPHEDVSRWREVDYCTASRHGEPFDALIDWKKYLPNPTQRLCTEWLKVRAALGFAISLGFPFHRERDAHGKLSTVGDFDQFLGIRADEPRRIGKNRTKPNVELPLVDTGVTRGMVLDFWRAQPFDLHVRAGEGNCRLCFEKGIPQLRNVIREAPDEAGIDRWIAREERVGAVMKKGHSYTSIAAAARRQLPIFDIAPEPDADHLPCACGD